MLNWREKKTSNKIRMGENIKRIALGFTMDDDEDEDEEEEEE